MVSCYIKSKTSPNKRAVEIADFVERPLSKVLFAIIWVAGLVSILLAIFDFIRLKSPIILIVASIFIVIFLFYCWIRTYYINKLQVAPNSITPKQAKIMISESKTLNLFSVFSFELSRATGHLFIDDRPIDTSQFIKEVIKAKDITFLLNRLSFSREDFFDLLQKINFEHSAAQIIMESLNIASKADHPSIETRDVLLAVFNLEPSFQKVLSFLKLNLTDVESIIHWHDKIANDLKANKDFLNWRRLRLTGGFGRDWAYGYTNFLKQYSTDLTEFIEKNGLGMEIIGRDREIKQIEEALLHSSGSNVLIVGDEGVGKTSTIMGFAKKVIEGQVVEDFRRFHIFQLDVDEILSNLASPSELIHRLSSFLNEALYAGNVIILIEDIDRLLSSKDLGDADITSGLMPFLDNPAISIIGTCGVGAYNDLIVSNTALAQRIVRVSINEPSEEELTQILEEVVSIIEYKTKSLVSYEAIKATIKLSEQYVLNMPNPEKSISLLEGAVIKASNNRGQTIVLPRDIEAYLAEKSNLPLGEIKAEEKQKLLNLAKLMHEKIIGQDQAVDATANAMKRARAEFADSVKPIGSFLFLGPTGVGKTETAKALADAYFGGSDQMIRFDMTEFQNDNDIYRLIGEKFGDESSSGLLIEAIQEKPFCLLLLDELEKANPAILNLLLQILDEGILTDINGKKVSFANSIIIATSNAGAEFVHESIKNGEEYSNIQAQLTDYLIKNHLLKPELLNRFTEIVAFKPLEKEELRQIIMLKLRKLADDIKNNKGIDIYISTEVVDRLAEIGYSPEMGARPLERAITDKIENIVADKILKGEIDEGSKLEITHEMIG